MLVRWARSEVGGRRRVILTQQDLAKESDCSDDELAGRVPKAAGIPQLGEYPVDVVGYRHAGGHFQGRISDSVRHRGRSGRGRRRGRRRGRWQGLRRPRQAALHGLRGGVLPIRLTGRESLIGHWPGLRRWDVLLRIRKGTRWRALQTALALADPTPC